MQQDVALIFYCESCGVRVPEADVERGLARRFEGRAAYCSACSQRGLANPPKKPIEPTPEVEAAWVQRHSERLLAQSGPLKAFNANETVEMPAPIAVEEAASMERESQRKILDAARKRKRQKLHAYGMIGALVAAVLLLVLIPLMFSSKNEETPKSANSTARKTATEPVKPDPKPSASNASSLKTGAARTN